MENKLKNKNSAIDLTDLALGILILGIAVSIGANILLSVRDSRLSELDTYTTANYTSNATDSVTLSNAWVESITSVVNQTGGETITASGNYTFTVGANGQATVVFDPAGSHYGTDVNITYSSYNTSRPDWELPDQAATGLAEYGNWFDIIVIVGIAGLILSLIFLAFTRRDQGTTISY